MLIPALIVLFAVPAFEAPVVADWNGDDLPDLIISEGFDVNPYPDPYGMGDPCYGHF